MLNIMITVKSLTGLSHEVSRYESDIEVFREHPKEKLGRILKAITCSVEGSGLG